MGEAACHFGRPWHRDRAEDALRQLATAHAQGSWRVRLLLDAGGQVMAEAYPLPQSPARVRVRLACAPVEAPAPDFLRFKTTRREHYDVHAPGEPGIFDTLLWNAAGELTEFTRGNVAVHLDGRWVTPPLHSGLLPGVERAEALRQGRVVEQVVQVDDLARATGLAFMNSLRGWIDAELHGTGAAT
jgi:para-aminobenzoate synthetase/4-amino-4-deoxychorismate lyase